MTNDPKLNAVRLVNDFSFAMLEEYIRHLPRKGESWKTMSRAILEDKLEVCSERALHGLPADKQTLRAEFIDIANLAMLLWHRLGEEEK